MKAGRFKDEIVPVTIKTRKGDTGGRHRRASASTAPRLEALAKLRPAFIKNGTVTAGNASRHQ